MATATLEDEKKAEKRRRQKARRRSKDLERRISEEWYNKPMEEWDNEELARGRPRAADGTFRGSAPKWVSREIHEEAVRRFTNHATAELRGIVPKALETIVKLITDDSADENGKPYVPASVKLQASQWVVEHLVGKPTQRIEADISVKLQGILSKVMVSPDEHGGYKPAIDVVSWTEDPDEDLALETG